MRRVGEPVGTADDRAPGPPNPRSLARAGPSLGTYLHLGHLDLRRQVDGRTDRDAARIGSRPWRPRLPDAEAPLVDELQALADSATATRPRWRRSVDGAASPSFPGRPGPAHRASGCSAWPGTSSATPAAAVALVPGRGRAAPADATTPTPRRWLGPAWPSRCSAWATRPPAEREIAQAGELAPPSARGLVDLLVALVLQRTGHLDASLAAYGRALARLRRDGDDANVARLLLNRGTLRAYQGDFQAALDDLRESERLATELELWVLAAMAAHNLGFALGRRGDVPAALAAFDRAEAAYASQGDPPRARVAALAADRCEVFLSVGLARDAVEAARAGPGRARRCERRHPPGRGPPAPRPGPPGPGRRRRRRRPRRRRRQPRSAPARRTPWAAVADYVAMQAEILATEDSALRPPRRHARPHSAHRPSAGGAGLAGRGHARAHVPRPRRPGPRRPEVARRELADVAGARRRGSARLRVEAWHATALLRLADDDRAGAKRALRRGLAVVDEHRAALGRHRAALRRRRPRRRPGAPRAPPGGGRRAARPRCSAGRSGAGPAPCASPRSPRPTTRR